MKQKTREWFCCVLISKEEWKKKGREDTLEEKGKREVWEYYSITQSLEIEVYKNEEKGSS